MARQGFLNGKLYTYTAEEEAAQDVEESKLLLKMLQSSMSMKDKSEPQPLLVMAQLKNN